MQGGMIAMSLAIVGSLGLSKGLVIGFYLGSTVPGGIIALSLEIVGFLAWLQALFLEILPRIDSSRRHDHLELSDRLFSA